MGKSSSLQTNFLGGEWSPFSAGRVDLPAYKTALASCLNAFPLEEGCWVRRPGSALGGNTYLGRTSAKIIDFSLTGSTPIKLELTVGYCRFWWGDELMYDGEELATAISPVVNGTQVTVAANPVDPVTGTGQLFTAGTEVMLVPQDATSQLALGAVLSNRTFILVSTGNPLIWGLQDGVNETSVLDAGNNWLLGMNIQMQRVCKVITPYLLSTDLPNIRLVQSEMHGTLLHPNYPPQKLTATSLRTSALDPSQFTGGPNSLQFSISPVIFQDGPYLNPSTLDRSVSGCNFVPDDGDPAGHLVNGTMTLVGGDLPNNGQGFLPTDQGRLVRFLVEPPTFDLNATYGSLPPKPSVVKYGTSYYVCVAASPTTGAPIQISGQVPGQIPNVTASVTIGTEGTTTNLTTQAIELVYWVAIPPAICVWHQWGVILSVTNSTTCRVQIFSNYGNIPFNTGPQQSQQIVPITYQLGVYSQTTGYPSCGTYHEGRLWLGGAVPNRVDGSNVINAYGPSAAGLVGAFNSLYYPNVQQGNNGNDLYIFSATDQNGNVLASNGISATLNSSDTNEILWMQPNLQGIVMGTPGGEWLIQASNQNLAITPSNIQAHRITKYGCANIEPRPTGLTTVFVQKLGRRVLEFLADVFSGRFYGPNLSEYARHLTAPGVQDIAFQEEQTPIIWARLGDGTLAGCTYRRIAMFSSQPPLFMGWHRHTMGHGRSVISISAGTDPSTLSQALAMVTTGASQYGTAGFFEIFTQQQEPQDGLGSAWFVDGGLTPVYASVATQGGQQGLLLSGLWPLNGQTLTAWVAGLDAGDYPVSGGTMFIPFGGTFTLTNILDLSASVTQTSKQAVPSNIGAPFIQAVIGSTYTSNGQRLRDLDPQSSATQMGPSLGKTRRPHMAAILFDGVVAGSVSVGTSLTGVVPLQPISVTNLNETVMDPTQLFEGIWFDAIVGESDFEGQLCWQITRPYPCEIMAVETFQQTQER